MTSVAVKTGFRAEEPVCCILALSYMADKPFEETVEFFHIVRGPSRRKFRKGWMGYSNMDEIVAAGRVAGIKLKTTALPRRTNLANFVASRSGKYIVRVGGHAITIIDGEAYDQICFGEKITKKHPLARKLVTDVVEYA